MTSQNDINNYVIDDVEADTSTQLEHFRQQWLQEVKAKSTKKSDEKQSTKDPTTQTTADRADQLYRRGMQQENRGRIDTAVKLYREAIRCDYNVESRMRYVTIDDSDTYEDIDGVSSSSVEPLVARLSGLSLTHEDSETTNLVNLPTEILLLIFRHVVSSHVDMTSLSALAATCRRLFVISRDVLLWRSIYERVYGKEELVVGDVRSLLKVRPFPRMDGVYVSKITYFREGDPTVMSRFYSPFQCVTYYRYIRFMSDQTILFVTCEDEPRTIIPKMASRTSAHNLPLRVGKYHVSSGSDNSPLVLVSAILKDYKPRSLPSRNRRTRRAELKYVMTDAEFEIDFELATTRPNSLNRKRSNKLSWRRYLCRYNFGLGSNISGNPTSSESEVNLQDQHPPFYFCHVNSYHMTSEGAV